VPVLQSFRIILALLVTLTLHGCAVDVAAAGVNAVVGDDEEESDED
jgi:hypothetical protein